MNSQYITFTYCNNVANIYQKGNMDSIIVDNITKVYGNKAVVDSLSFRVKKGSIHGFLGPNGAGKTTTMKIIAGVIPPTAGRVLINGNNVQENLITIKSSLGVLLENPPLYKDMEVEDFLRFVCRLHKTSKSTINDKIDYTIKKLDLESVRHRLIGNLSKGFRQRVGVAQAIVFQPDIVILDEPTVGLDPNSVIEMRDLIRELGKDHTVLLSSHLLHEIELVCDEVTIIDNGVMQASAPMSQIAAMVKDKMIIHAVVKSWSEELKNEFLSKSYINKIEFNQSNNNTSLKIHLDSLEDNRELLLKELVQSNIGILEFYKEKIDLEKIFLEVTGAAR